MIINSIIAGAGGGTQFEYDEEYTYAVPTGQNIRSLYIPFTPTQPFMLFVYRVDAFEGDYRNYIRFVELLCDDITVGAKVGLLRSIYDTSYAKAYSSSYTVTITNNGTDTYSTTGLNINSNGIQIAFGYNFRAGKKYRAIVKYLPTLQ